jgi:hypothetical protein
MRYLVVDAVGQKAEVDAVTAFSAREKAKRRFVNGPIGELKVFEQLDPVQDNREATREFFGARPPIIL